MAEPGAGVALLVFLLSITLLVLGIERVIAGIGLAGVRKSSRIGNIILGVLTIALGIGHLISIVCSRVFDPDVSYWFTFYGYCKNTLWYNSIPSECIAMVKVICNRCRYIVNSHIIYGVCIAITWRVPFDINISN